MAKNKPEIKKTQAFREAAAALGIDADVTEIAAWIKDKHGIAVDPSVLYSYRSLEKRNGNKGHSMGNGRKKTRGRPAGSVSNAIASSTSNDPMIDFLKVVKEYEGKLGADAVRKMVGVVID